ncbi:MAG: ArnT family glycosyltransferase [Thermoguttaceae bacterium]
MTTKIPTRLFSLAVIALLLLQGAMLAYLNWATSLNRTEVGHLGAAVYFWKTGRFDVFHVNPPLTRMIDGIPIVLAAPEYDWKSYSPRPQDRSEWSIGASFINANSPEKIRWVTFLSRCSLIPLILLGSWFGYRFASELYGQPAGVIFLVLWIFSPLILGWGATICPDVVAASLGIIGIYTFWHWLKNPTLWNAAIAGVTLGLLPLAKLTWIIAAPLWIIIWAVWKFKNAKQFVAILLLALYVINMGYGFDGSFRQLKDYKFLSQTLSGNEVNEKSYSAKPGNRFEKSLLGYVPVPLPAEFVLGIDTQKRDFERGIESYFCGVTSEHGWWNYYLVTLAIKEPLGVWGLFLLTIFVSCFAKNFNSSWRDELILIIPMVSLLIFISSQTGFSLHPRYIVLVLPFVYLWVSKLGQAFTLKNRIVSLFTSGLLIWVIAGSLWYYPHSMSYFNESIGGAKNGPKYLLGSNVDWGQNLYFLKSWHEKHPEAKPLHIVYSGAESLERIGIQVETTIPENLEPGWYVIGVNELYGSKQYEKFRSLKPVDRIGWAIYVYHITEETATK